jgi:peptidoglycan/LPS O-acetylase OafA/YrhL
MITAYLFFGRLVRVGVKPIHWPSLYLGRVMRLTPLYVVAMLVMVLLVLAASQWQLKQSPTAWIVPMLQWLTFTVTGMPDLNGLERTKLIIAGVTWSLKFEWVFYASLLLLAPISKGFRSGTVTALALLLILALCQPLSPNGDVAKFLSFVPGMLAAVWAPRLAPITRAHPVAASLLALACLGVEVACFPTAYGLPQTLLLGVSFLIVASGNTLFGLLAWRVSLALGDLAYSIYLLHGLLLYTCLGLVLRPFGAADLSPLQHWAAIAALTPVLIVLCQLTHRYIEQPGIQATPRLAARLWPRPNLN